MSYYSERGHNPFRAALLLIAAMVAMCATGAVVVVVRSPPPIRTHRDAVAYLLDQRGIAYRAIAVSSILDRIPGYNPFPHETHPYTVRITLPDGSARFGSLECSAQETRCALTARDLGIVNVRAPERTAPPRWPWRRWMAQLRRVAGVDRLAPD